MKQKSKVLLTLFFVLVVQFCFAQERTITGVVTDSNTGMPLPGVNIVVKGTTNGVLTGFEGEYSLKNVKVGQVIVYSYLGYKSKEVVVQSQKSIDVTLERSMAQLDQVVITAGGVKIQKREQGNQVTTIKAEELMQGQSFNVGTALTAKVPGLQVSAVGGGINPDMRLVLRGNRSLLGDNRALLVVDNVIVPSTVLGNLNPRDIKSIQVLNGAGAAAIYGSDASNGAIIVTTKKGKEGVSRITVSHTATFEQASFVPETQKRYGSGTKPDAIPTYTPYENQQYGPEFDGSMVNIGKPLVDGSIQTVPYSPRDDKDEFWELGVTNQTDLSLSNGSEKGSIYFSAQYLNQTSVVPGDEYNRFTIRVNGTRELAEDFTLTYNTYYVQNRYDQTTAFPTAFNNVMMTPAHVPLLRYSDWQTDPYANPNGYYNEYYDNPYFTLDNNRQNNRNDYLTGVAQIKWFPIDPLSFMFRVSIYTRNYSSKSWSNRFDYSDYTTNISPAKSQDEFRGFVGDNIGFSTQLTPEFQAQFKKDLTDDFSINVLLGASLRDNRSKNIGVNSSNMAIPGLYNIKNTTLREYGSEGNFRSRQIGLYGDVRLNFRDYLYLHFTGRNDWVSVLTPENRSIFYPAADISFIATDALSFLKESEVIDEIKIRGGISKVGKVNIGPYSLKPTFSQSAGYPFSGVVGYSMSGRIVTNDLKPEETTTIEAGVDFSLLDGRIFGSATAYTTSTINQTVPIDISPSTGFGTYLTNVGEVRNRGIETALHVTPIRTNTGWSLTVGGNFTYNQNEVISLFEGSDNELQLGSWGSGAVYAIPGKPFPYLKTTKYVRNDAGKIIVDANTGLPTASTKFFDMGQTVAPYRLGLDLQLNYKNFRLAAVAEYRTGNMMFNQSTTQLYFSGAGIRTTDFNRERFVVPNSVYDANPDPNVTKWVKNTNITTNTGGANFWTNGPAFMDAGENFVYSAAFWKLREVSLSYSFPRAMLDKIGFVKSATISVQGRNLLLFTPDTNVYTDPEYSAFGADSNAIGITGFNDAPPARYYGLTLSVTL